MAQPVRNYAREMEKLVEKHVQRGERPRLLLHACCAPCLSGVLEYAARFFDTSLVYYNPNIAPREEYEKRLEEVKRLISEMPLENPVKLLSWGKNTGWPTCPATSRKKTGTSAL